MKKLIIASAILLAVSVNAQVGNIAVGKKIQMFTESKGANTVSMMGQEMEIPSTAKTTSEIEVKSVTTDAITATITLKRIAASTNIMGQENSFDSDEKPTSNNPMAAALLKNLNKPQDVVLEKGKIRGKTDIGITGVPTSNEVAKKLFLAVDVANIKEGFKWTEQADGEGTKTNTIYTITKVTTTDIEVTATSSIKIEATINQMGMDMKQNISGSVVSVSVYDAATMLLKADATKMDLSGTIQIMGNDAPMSVKLITTTTVK